MRHDLIATLILLGLAATALAQADAQPAEIDVEKDESKLIEQPSLRFLRENRDFLRAQLDRLRQIRREMNGDALELSERDLLLRDLMAGIEADEDSLARERRLLAQRGLLQSISELGELESQLDRLEALLAGQTERLDRIQADYEGRQRTALLILIQNFPQEGGPEAIVLEDEDSMRWEIALDEAQRDALRAGGAAQILHEFVEPRSLRFDLRFLGEGWESWPAQSIRVEPLRDRMNLFSIDLARLEPDTTQPLPTSQFSR